MVEASPHALERNQETDRSDEIVDALQAIVTDVDAYLSNWCRQLDQCVESRDAETNPDAILQQRYSEFQNEKMRWERQRKLEQQQLQEQAKQLTDAWMRLEDQQRRFLQMKNAQRQNGSEREPVAATTITVDQDSPSADDGNSANTDSLACRDARPPRQMETNSKPSARESAIRQFQQLQREIQSSRPNANRRRGVNYLSSGERH